MSRLTLAGVYDGKEATLRGLARHIIRSWRKEHRPHGYGEPCPAQRWAGPLREVNAAILALRERQAS